MLSKFLNTKYKIRDTLKRVKKFVRSNKRKVVIVSLIVIIILSPLVYLTFRNPKESAAWWDDSYSYRQPFNFTHDAAISSERKVTFSLDTAELIAAGVMQSDCDDTRFTDVNGKELKYDLTGTCDNAATTYEVIFNSIINGLNPAYVYYGNPTAINAEIDSTPYTELTPSGGDPAITDRTNEEVGPGPVGYWKFDEGTDNTCSGGTNDACDASGHENDLAKTNATWQAENLCISGKCLYFDGTGDYLTRSDDNEFDFTASDDFTITGWFRHGPISTSADYIIAKHESGTAGGYKVYIDSDGDLAFAVDDDGTWDPAATDISGETLSKNYDDNSWHHFAAVKDGTTGIYLYVDGLLVDSEESLTETGSLANAAALYVGIDADGSSNSFDGFIDDVKIYPYVRTAVQIKTDFIEKSGLHGSAAVLGDRTSWLSDGLVGYWKMDESSWTNDCSTDTVFDSSGNGNDADACPASTGPDGGDAGEFGHGGLFDGSDDYLKITHHPSLNITGDISIGAWIKSNGASIDHARIVEKGYNTDGYHFGGGSGDGRDLSVWFASTEIIDTDEVLSDGVWSHVMMTYDGEYVRIFQDGVIIASTAHTGTRAGNTAQVEIGGESGNMWLNATLDEVRVYNRALSPTEVRQLYNWAPGPVGYWPLDENTGTSTVYDKSASANTYNATLYGITEDEWVPGRIGSGIKFSESGTDYANTGDINELDNTTAFTIAAWVKEVAFNGWGEIFNKNGADANNVIAISYGGSQGQIVANVSNDPPSTAGYGYTSNAYSTNEWFHLAVVFDGTGSANADRVKIYINGVAQTLTFSNTIATSTDDNSTAFKFGMMDETILDEIKVYNYIRTQGQIIEDMLGSPQPASGGGNALSSPVGYWKFDEGYGDTANNSGNAGSTINGDLGDSGQTCPATGDTTCPTWTNDGKFGKALDFETTGSPDAYIDLGVGSDGSPLDLDDGNFTLSAWVNLESIGAHRCIICQCNAAQSRAIGLYYNHNDTRFEMMAHDGSLQYAKFDQLVPPSLSTWYHLVGVRDGSTIKIYVNGVLGTTTDTVGTLTDMDADSWSIGRLGDANTYYWDGQVDEVKAYNFALTEDQVKVEYNKGSAQTLGAVADHDEENFSLPDPAGAWNFDENTGQYAYDDSGNENYGTLGTGATADSADPSWIAIAQAPRNANGLTGSALNFDGSNDYLTVDDSDNDLEFTGDLTLSAWYKTSYSANYQTILSEGQNNDWIYNMAVNTSGQFACKIYQANSGSGYLDTADSTSTADGNWHYGVCLVSGTTLYVYVDGILVATDSTPTGTRDTSTAGDALIGKFDWPSGYAWFNGTIDGLNAYGSALTQAQISWLYNRGGPVGHWKLDECEGTTAYDSSNNSNNGTITIGATGSNDDEGTCTSGDSGDAWYNGRSGKRDASLDFDGTDDYVSVNDDALWDLQSDEEITVSAWIKFDSDISDTFANVWGDYTGPYLQVRKYGAGSYRLLWSTGTAKQSNLLSFNTTDWYHVAVVRNGNNTATFYRNGILVGADTSGSEFDRTPDNVWIGADEGGEYFNGKIDDVRIYNYALTATQVKTLYNHGAVYFGE